MAQEKQPDQVWTLVTGGVDHRVEATGSTTHHVRWYADGEVVATKRSMDEHLRLESTHGRLSVRFGTLGKPRRASLGEVDLVPEVGSPAAAYEDRVRAHPERYAALQTAGGVGKVLVPILVAALLARLVVAIDVPWPDWSLPDLPLPDLPSVPWPDLPSLPALPSLPDLPALPGWARWVLDHAQYVWPVVLAFVLARAEIRRRRRQDELRAEQDEQDEQP